MSRRKTAVLFIVICAFFIAIIAILCLSRQSLSDQLTEVQDQVSYLSDTTDIILTDVDGLEASISQTIEEETSLVERYSVTVTDMDFAEDTVDVSVEVIPKEYTETTEISVFFGTNECSLSRDVYSYSGEATLPLDDDFAGNLTFLFSDGKKRNTEVYSSYKGIQTYLGQVLSADADLSADIDDDGNIIISGTLSYDLTGCGLYQFDEFSLVAEYDGDEVICRDVSSLAASTGGSVATYNGEASDEDSTEAEAYSVIYPTDGMDGSAEISVSYAPTAPGSLRLYLRATTPDGYRFERTLLECNVTSQPSADGEPPSLTLEGTTTGTEYYVYDRNGAEKKLN
ncbi:MAG: hypothetical protein LUI02_01430 [Clostridiales bacterium]|nr:hypothetical protein [Clostridiales bacterium]